MLDVAQVVAWTRMFTGYAGTESVVLAAQDTFDPAKPCKLCLAVGKARDAASHQSQASPSPLAEKMVMMFQDTGIIFQTRPAGDWPAAPLVHAPMRRDAVPLPPPRTLLG
jgi:hypothetical protein